MFFEGNLIPEERVLYLDFNFYNFYRVYDLVAWENQRSTSSDYEPRHASCHLAPIKLCAQ